MNLDPEHLHRVLVSRDARFDGRVYVGVSTTGIYCRPVCTARTPKLTSCTFYGSAAAAERQGFRPCLRRRPELAPGQASVDATRRLAMSAAHHIDAGFLTDRRLDDLAATLGVTDRHLRRVFTDEFGVTPVEFAQTQRLLLAKQLLTDTGLSVTDVAMAAGFGSLRRFNTLFKDRYRLKPTELRRQRNVSDDHLVLQLSYRPPYAWDDMLTFLSGRTILGVESVENGVYRRTVRVRTEKGVVEGWLAVTSSPKRHALTVHLAPSLRLVIPKVLMQIRSLFDLSCVPDEVARRLGPLASANPGLRVPGAFDGFEMAVRAILGQQVTVAAARTIAGRVAATFGTPFETPFPSLNVLFPEASTVANATSEKLGKLGIVRTRVEAIRCLGSLVANGELVLDPSADVDLTLERLQAIAGIGPWTAHYIAMRALSWPDAFLESDYGVKKALGDVTPRVALAQAEAWRPWRSYAVMHLWFSLKETKS